MGTSVSPCLVADAEVEDEGLDGAELGPHADAKPVEAQRQLLQRRRVHAQLGLGATRGAG